MKTFDDVSIIEHSKKSHKFFDKTISNDLTSLTEFLTNLQSAIVNDNILRMPQDLFDKHNKLQSGAATLSGDFYNIFNYTNPGIVSLYNALSETMNEVCDYYDIDRKKQQYMIHGWFNFDYPNDNYIDTVSPIIDPKFFHDHSGGKGAPEFHGYYCVNAEPSTTFYKIHNNPDTIFHNINKNNRLIISETGHPHGKDDWLEENPRITIAYDISPLESIANPQFIGIVPWVPFT